MWALFYKDGSVVTSGIPDCVPRDGLVVVAHPKHENGNSVYPGDYFVYHNDNWWPHDVFELHRLILFELNEVKAVRQGRMVSPDEYETICRRAQVFKWERS